MNHLTWWLGGAALATTLVGHWLVTKRMMAVSGRFTALVDRVRFGPQEDDTAEMSDSELVAAIQEATAETFGSDAVTPVTPPASGLARPREKQTVIAHVLFLIGVTAGGLLSALAAGDFAPTLGLRGAAFARLTGGSDARAMAVLFVGGTLVGVGTRMGGGCTSGHGLCGVSRLQRGSLINTAAFFGAGIATSLLLARLM